ncbi:hypothetical protein [Thermomonospora amylolytica]|uniref:hypothetical protein n=1 Tax=Thermomonospora amylolytica TaxID=1411117 RepID=UPI000E6C5BE0|nr:hypothetical protein [Thermomonospora amylolytica]
MTGDDERREALQRLAGVLRGQGYRVTIAGWHLTAGAGDGRVAEVWVQRRPSDDWRLWYTGPGGAPICEVTRTMDAVVAVKGVLSGRRQTLPPLPSQ